MKDLEFPPIDVLYPDDVSPIVYHLQNEKGMSDAEVVAWFKKNRPDYVVNCELYLEAKNAGRPNPLHNPIM